MAIAANTRATFRQLGSLGGGRRVVLGSSIQSNGTVILPDRPH